MIVLKTLAVFSVIAGFVGWVCFWFSKSDGAGGWGLLIAISPLVLILSFLIAKGIWG